MPSNMRDLAILPTLGTLAGDYLTTIAGVSLFGTANALNYIGMGIGKALKPVLTPKGDLGAFGHTFLKKSRFKNIVSPSS